MDFFKNRSGSNYNCFLSGRILRKEDYEAETWSQGSAGWPSDNAACSSAYSCRILSASAVQPEKTIWKFSFRQF